MMTTNPLISHLARKSGGAILPSHWLIYFVLGLIAVSLWVLPIDYRASIWPTIRFIREILTVFTPILYLQVVLRIAGIGARRIAHDRARDWFLLLCLTNLTDRQIVSAYLLSALRSVRRSLAFLAGCISANIALTVWTVLTHLQVSAAASWEVGLEFLFWVGFADWIGLAMVLGVGVGMRVRGESDASLAATVITLGGGIGWLVALLAAVGPIVNYIFLNILSPRDDETTQRLWNEAAIGFQRGLFVALLPLILAVLLLWLLPRRARRGI